MIRHGPLTILLNLRSQNVPKTKGEGAKPLEITEDRKKVLGAVNIG